MGLSTLSNQQKKDLNDAFNYGVVVLKPNATIHAGELEPLGTCIGIPNHFGIIQDFAKAKIRSNLGLPRERERERERERDTYCTNFCLI